MYDSKLEAGHAETLEILKSATNKKQRVVEVEEQVPFKCYVNNQHVCTYLLDFKVTYADGSVDHFDSKGFKNKVYLIKKKLVQALFGIEIKELTKAKTK